MLAAARIAGGFFRSGAAHDALFFRGRRRGLHLSERSEHHVGEGAIHGLAHDHGENESGGSVERAGHDQHFAVQNESQQRCGKAGVGIQQRDDRRHVRAADGSDQQHSENQRHNHHDREQDGVRGIHHQRDRQPERRAQHGEADDVLPAIDDGPLRQDLLQLSGGDHAARKGERSDDDFQRDLAHLKARDRARCQRRYSAMPIMAAESAPNAWLNAVRCGTAVICTRPRGMPTPAPMISGMRIHLYCASSGLKSVATDGQGRADLSRQNAPARGRRRTQELERKNEENNRDNVGEIEILLKRERGHDCFDLPDLNMRSMRSVIRNPPTMLLNEAATAIAPRIVVEPRLMPSGDDDGGDDHDGVERVGQRHQRRVKQRRNALDHFKPHEPGQNEDIQIRDEIRWHDCSFACVQCPIRSPVIDVLAASAASPRIRARGH